MTPYRPVSSGGTAHHRDHRPVGLVVGVDQLADHRAIAHAHVIGEDHREGFVPDQVLGHQHGVPQAQLLLLTDVRHLGEVADVADLPEHLDVALLLEQVLELVGEVEVVLDRPLLAGGDDDDLLDPGGDGLLDRVLDDRLVHQRQHLLGLRLGGREEACAPPGGGEDSLANAHGTSTIGGETVRSGAAPVYHRTPDAPVRDRASRSRMNRRIA